MEFIDSYSINLFYAAPFVNPQFQARHIRATSLMLCGRVAFEDKIDFLHYEQSF